jgi:hypothetical protein
MAPYRDANNAGKAMRPTFWLSVNRAIMPTMGLVSIRRCDPSRSLTGIVQDVSSATVNSALRKAVYTP